MASAASSKGPSRSSELVELRRIIAVLKHRDLRQRMSRLVDDLERDADLDSLHEIRASRELAAAQADVIAAQVDVAAARAERDALEAELGAARRERDDALARLRELRELAPNGLGDQLIEVCVRVEAEHPTQPPMLAVRQAARLVRAVRS